MKQYKAVVMFPYYIDKNNKVYVLLCNEYRRGICKSNFIGGKVEHFDSSLFETGKREFMEETGGLYSDVLSTLTDHVELYHDEYKYVVIPFRVYDMDVTSAKLSEIESIYWTPLKNLYNYKFTKYVFHKWCHTSIQHIIKRYNLNEIIHI